MNSVIDNVLPTDRRWSWVEINVNAIRHNINQIKTKIGRDCKFLAVVKANAYGHGAVRIAKTALNSGAAYLGVASVDEAIELRRANIDAPILILSQPPITSVNLLIKYDITPSIYTSEFAVQYAEAADQKAKLAPFHLAINTGMNRIGVKHTDVVAFLKQVSFHRALQLEGTFTHFATADSTQTLDFKKQLDNFTFALQIMKSTGFDPGIVHCANSAAAIRYPETRFDMVRAGIAMYGYHPCKETTSLINLHPSMSIHARITDERILNMGEGVSYDMNYRSRGGVKICTIPIGYADGLRLSLSGKIDVIYKGKKFKQIGNICMDQCMFEIDINSGLAQARYNAQTGDEVIILGKDEDSVITIEELAYKAQTNVYEIACGFSRRMPIIYI